MTVVNVKRMHQHGGTPGERGFRRIENVRKVLSVGFVNFVDQLVARNDRANAVEQHFSLDRAAVAGQGNDMPTPEPYPGHIFMIIGKSPQAGKWSNIFAWIMAVQGSRRQRISHTELVHLLKDRAGRILIYT